MRFLNTIGVFIFLLIWELVCRLGLVNPLFLSPPTQILKAGLDFFLTGQIFPHILISLEEFSLGFLLAILIGITLGLLIGYFKKLESLTSSIIYSLYSTPTITLLPLIIIWAGLGIASKVVIVFLASFFPILINTISGVKNLNPEFIHLARSFGASEKQLFPLIIFPATLPYILTGLRLAIPRSIIGMIVGEFFVSNKGLGYLISFYGSTFQTDKLLATVVIVVIISITVTWTLGVLEKKLQRWKTI